MCIQALYRIVSYRIVSYRIVSHRNEIYVYCIVSNSTVSYVQSAHIVSYRIVSTCTVLYVQNASFLSYRIVRPKCSYRIESYVQVSYWMFKVQLLHFEKFRCNSGLCLRKVDIRVKSREHLEET